jgi:hypothetical protein
MAACSLVFFPSMLITGQLRNDIPDNKADQHG